MEQEFKWDATPELQDAVLFWALSRDAAGANVIEMDARYFDTADGQLAADKLALRIRRENQDSLCCMKLRGAEAVEGGLHAHEEYECPASCLAEGLVGLPAAGAPRELCEHLRTLDLVETCRITFTRYAVQVHAGTSTAELALDRGQMSSGGKSAPLCEIELELKDGAAADFLQLGKTLARDFQLTPQPLSKLARAKAL